MITLLYNIMKYKNLQLMIINNQLHNQDWIKNVKFYKKKYFYKILKKYIAKNDDSKED